MKRRSGPRKTANLPASIHHQLNMYATAAVAAGVSAIALAQSAEAKIVYTPAHQHLPINQFFSLDLNHDGIADFTFLNRYWTASGVVFVGRLTVDPAGRSSTSANEIWAKPCSSGLPGVALALPPGVKVGPKGHFSHRGKLMAYSYFDGGARNDVSNNCIYGLWNDVSKRYLGLKFIIKGKIHFGWARLDVSAKNDKVAATLTGYAYETIPNKSIKAGETKEAADDPANEDSAPTASLTNPIPNTPDPATLGALAMGAPALSLRRRKEFELEVDSKGDQ